MAWHPNTVHGMETYDAMLLRVRAITDACFEGPQAFFDPDRDERSVDYTPVSDLARTGLPLTSVQPAGIRRLPITGTAGARAGGPCARPHPDRKDAA